MKNKIKNKTKIIVTSSIALVLTTASAIMSNIISSKLLMPRRDTFKEGLDKYGKNPIYNSKYYLQQNANVFKIPSNENYDLHVEYLKCPTKSNKTIYYLHGYGSTRAQAIWFLEKYHNLGFNVVIYDHIGSGDSGGTYSTLGVKECRDLKTVKNYIELKYGKSEIVALHGISMGASTAMYYGELYGDVDYIIADCGFSTMKDIVTHQLKVKFKLPKFPFIPLANIGVKLKAGYTLNKVNCIKSISSENFKKIKLLIVHGSEDAYTPKEMAYKLYEMAIGITELEIFEGAKHSDCYQSNPTRYEKLMADFLSS